MINQISQSVRLKILKRFLYELPFYVLDYWIIVTSLVNNLIRYKSVYKKDLVFVTGSDSNFANSLFQLLDNINSQIQIKDVIVYDLGMTNDQVQNLKRNYREIKYRKFNFSEYPSFFKERDDYGKLGAYAWKPSIIWDVFNEYKCQVVWLDTGNLINNKFKYVRIVLSNLGFFSPISAGRVKDYTHNSTLKNLDILKKDEQKRMLTGGFACFDWESKSSKELLYEWKESSLSKGLIIPEGSNPNNHKWDQSLLTVLVYKSKQYLYLPKIKKIFGIKVNQNPGRYFYLVEGTASSKSSKIRENWYKENKTISTLTIRDSKIVWVTSLSNIGKVKLNILKQKKVIVSVFDDENLSNLEENALKFKNRFNYVDIFITTSLDIKLHLEKLGKEVFLLDSEKIDSIKEKLSDIFKLSL